MCSKASGASLCDVLGYSFPRLHEGKEWYIDFVCLDPAGQEARRKKYYVPADKSKRRRRALAQLMIERLNVKLREGWNPWADNKSNKNYAKLEEVFERFELGLKDTFRPSSVHSYRSMMKIFREYLSSLNPVPAYAYQIDKSLILDFLDWVMHTRQGSARTRNNYKGWCSVLGTFMVERGYLPENPAKEIKKLRVADKNRQPLTAEMLKTLFVHLASGNKHFLLACMMEYYTFIRPNELRMIKIKDINIPEQTVYVDGKFSKNHKTSKVSLNEEIIRLLLELKTLESPASFYLFGKRFRPSADMADSDMFNKQWHKVRKSLKWPDEIKFYSLKDSGIRDLSNSAGVVTARNQARHSDISTTNKYLQGRDLEAPEGAKHFKGNLAGS